MCGLFGFYNYSGEKIEKLNSLTQSLAREATARGMDATGIAYTQDGRLIIQKEPKSAYSMDLKHADDAACVMGHTRHATQGDKRKNYNNHPFAGTCRNMRFALAHNGILYNDEELRHRHSLPKTKIQTDSYVAVQLLEKAKKLTDKTVKNMAETVEGSFAFSILGTDNTLWLVRDDSPLAMVHLPAYKLYVYASTETILYKALAETGLFNEIKTGRFSEIPIREGEILRLTPDGSIGRDKFTFSEYGCYGKYKRWDFGFTPHARDSTYIEDLKCIAACQGYAPEDIDEMLAGGFTPEEIEEYIYCLE